MKVYLLYYDTNYGSREEWNTFYTPCEVFDSAEKRQARIDFIRAQVDEDGEPVEYEFEEVDTELIVRECMNAVCDPRTTYLESMTESSAMYTARERIRKHFGG